MPSGADRLLMAYKEKNGVCRSYFLLVLNLISHPVCNDHHNVYRKIKSHFLSKVACIVLNMAITILLFSRHSIKSGLDSGLDSGIWTLDSGLWTLDSDNFFFYNFFLNFFKFFFKFFFFFEN